MNLFSTAPFKIKEIEMTAENLADVTSLLQGPFPTFFAVEDPVTVQDSIPRDLRSSKQTASPGKQAFQVFETYEDACRFAQTRNRALLVLEIKVAATVLPQLPLVERLGTEAA